MIMTTHDVTQIVDQDDHLGMHVTVSNELDAVLDVVFMSDADKATLKQYVGAISVVFTSLKMTGLHHLALFRGHNPSTFVVKT